MADSEAPRIKLIGPAKAPPVELLRWLFEARAIHRPARLDPRRPRDRYMHFGRALHRCSGRNINDIQVPALVRTLLDHGLAGPADSRSRGPFPDRLVVTLETKS